HELANLGTVGPNPLPVPGGRGLVEGATGMLEERRRLDGSLVQIRDGLISRADPEWRDARGAGSGALDNLRETLRHFLGAGWSRGRREQGEFGDPEAAHGVGRACANQQDLRRILGGRWHAGGAPRRSGGLDLDAE